jgi:uncharacterized protein
LEWDGNIPAFDVYYAELMKSKKYMDHTYKGMAEEKDCADQEQVSNPLNIVSIELLEQAAH